MMVNETAARNMPSGQRWQRTVPTQMPWMSGYTVNSPTSVIHFGQSPSGSPESLVSSPPRIQQSQLTPDTSPIAPAFYQMPSPTIMSNNNNQTSFVNTCNRGYFITPTTQTSPITTNSTTFISHKNTVSGPVLAQFDQPLLTVQSSVTSTISNSEPTVSQQSFAISNEPVLDYDNLIINNNNNDLSLNSTINFKGELLNSTSNIDSILKQQQQVNSQGIPQHMPAILTFMPYKNAGCNNLSAANDVNQSLPQTKRSSVEVDEDGSVGSQAPPSKQWLSESMMLRQFGSLNLTNNLHNIKHDSPNYDADAEIEEDDEEEQNSTLHKKKPLKQSDNEELERYVYLLFKDKRQSDLRQFSQGPNQSTLNRLARDEMDKINKAVVLWNPCIHGRPCNTTPEIEELADQNSDDSFGAIKNVLGKNRKIAADLTGQKSIIITEVSDDDSMMPIDGALYAQADEDLMVD